MIHFSLKYLLLLLVFLGIVFFIGNYFDEAVQTFDYESYLFADQPNQNGFHQFLAQDADDIYEISLLCFNSQFIFLFFMFPPLPEAKHFLISTPNLSKPFYSVNLPLLI